MIRIRDYGSKKVADYLKSGMKVKLVFYHGLGDTLLFYPCYLALKEKFPDVRIDLEVGFGQEEIFPCQLLSEEEYDYVFEINFYMSEGSGISKPAYCCLHELGIEPITDVAKLPRYESPLVAMHFQGTALPESVNCPQDVAQKIWNEVIDAELIPIECHFIHEFHNPKNYRYPFVVSVVRHAKPKVKSLIGLLQHCFAFIGVASGPFVTALSVMPERTIYLQKHHELSCYTELFIPVVNVLDYRSGTVYDLLTYWRHVR